MKMKPMGDQLLLKATEKTKKDATWWKDQMRTDMYLTSTQALELGVVDQII